MYISIPYGNIFIQLKIPNHAKIVYPNEPATIPDPRNEIRRVLNNPSECNLLPDIACGKHDAIIVINDYTRPAPSDLMLKAILQDLKADGIEED